MDRILQHHPSGMDDLSKQELARCNHTWDETVAKAPGDVFDARVRWERVRLGSESSSGGGAAGGVWKSWNLKSPQNP